MEPDLVTLRSEMADCRRCGLSATCRQAVFGEGNPHAPIMVVGEAPGKDEDELGRPFVGRSGRLLDKIFAACGFTRQEHIFISNIVKCRPPNNRPPTPGEAEACLPWLISQIEAVKPAILVLLGATALKYLVGPRPRITRDRGRWFPVLGRLAMPVYHPSALLRNPALKKDAWKDYQDIVRRYRELIDADHRTPHG